MGGRGERSPRGRAEKVDTVEVEHRTVYSRRGERDFEYDSAKSASNKEKHGIDFEEAQELWDDEDGIENDSPFQGERRFMWVAKRDGKMYTAVATIRDDSIRIISVRRARESEVYWYEKGIN